MSSFYRTIYRVNIWGGRTEETATNIATLSGSPDIKDQTFTSASNFMIIKFRSDEVAKPCLFKSKRVELRFFIITNIELGFPFCQKNLYSDLFSLPTHQEFGPYFVLFIDKF